MATRNVVYGTYTAMTVTNLQSLPNSPTAGWQSARVSNIVTLALDYEITIKLTTANTGAANDRAAHVYISRAMTTDGGTTWLHDDQGTGTLPTGAEGTTTIVAGGGNMAPLGDLVYVTTQMTMERSFLLSQAVGRYMPDGFSIVIANFTGAALSTSCVVAYRAVTETIA